MSTHVRNQKFFRRGKVLWNQGTLVNFLLKTQKNNPAWEIWRFFSLILLKLHFEWKIQPKDGHNQDLFSKIRALYAIFKKGQGRPHCLLLYLRACHATVFLIFLISRNIFTVILKVNFCKNNFIFQYFFMITNIKFKMFFIIFFLKSMYVSNTKVMNM